MMKVSLLKAVFILEIFQFLFSIFVYVGKQLDQEAKVNLKICGVKNWITKSYNTHIARYLKKLKQSSNGIRSVNKK